MEVTLRTCQSVPFYACGGFDPSVCAHGFSTRLGGVSPAPWDSLNLGANRGDAPERVAENFRRFCSAAGADPAALVKNHQVHGDLVRPVTRRDVMSSSAEPGVYEADGLITDEPGLADGVTAAQQGLGLKRGVHREEPLIEQGAQSQICPVGRPGGVERVLGVKGEGKGDRGGDGLLLLRRRGEVRAGGGRGLRLAAAGKGQGQRRAEKQQENTPTTHGEPHSHKSWIMAAMLPRRSPITR